MALLELARTSLGVKQLVSLVLLYGFNLINNFMKVYRLTKWKLIFVLFGKMLHHMAPLSLDEVIFV